MQNRYKLASEIELVGTLKSLAHAYEEVSVMRMQKVRKSVLSTRTFLDKLAEVFFDVKQSYHQEISKLIEKKNQNKSNVGKSMAVYISANARLYGDIINRVFDLFYADIQKKRFDDIFVVGSLGKSMLEEHSFKRSFKYFEVPDYGATFDQIKPIITAMLSYQTVRVYYGKFQNVLTQEPVVTDVSGEQSLRADPDPDSVGTGLTGEHKVNFYFEPALEEVMSFFQTQVFASLFKQTVHETELARFASRIKAMENAIVNIEQREKGLLRNQLQLKKLVDNKKRIESIAGINLWR